MAGFVQGFVMSGVVGGVADQPMRSVLLRSKEKLALP